MNQQYPGAYDPYIMQQQMFAQMHPAQFDPMAGQYATNRHKTTKKDILGYLQQLSQASEIVQIDEFETQRARHICRGAKQIMLLEKGVQPVPTSEGVLNVEYFLCPNCRKLILNKLCLDMN